MQLFDWQKNDVDRFLSANGTGALSSDTGAGKTVESLFLAKELNKPVTLVTGPKSTRRSWMQDAEKIWPEREFKAVDSSKQGKLNLLDMRLGKPGLYFAGIEWYRGLDWRTYPIDLHLADEVHKMAARDTKGLKALWTSNAQHRVAISATMVRNKIENIWGVLRWLYPDMEFWQPDEAYFQRHYFLDPDQPSAHTPKKRLRDLNPKYYWQFAELFFTLKKDFFAGLVVDGELIPGEIVSQIPAYVQHLKRENCCDAHPEGFATWPKPVTKIVEIETTPGQRKAHKAVDEYDIAWLGDQPLVVKMPLEARMRKLQIALAEPIIETDETGKPKVTFAPDAKSPKLDWIAEQASEGVLFGEQYVVMTHSKAWAKMAAERLGGFAWTGDEKQEKRDEAMEAFIRGEVRCIVAVIAAFGTGTTGAQLVANNLVWASRSDDGTDNTQGAGRLDRIGADRGMIEWELQSEGTEEAGIYSSKMQKQMTLNASLRAKA